ncbi:uncharacterized protein VTP21DRAFT_2054 [Calcarisporiella thermophila]|uniref:uncharacterized protein n=1 Tax=Calcarisporiella thermophila TaxID=911321 RepID=UPI003743C898
MVSNLSSLTTRFATNLKRRGTLDFYCVQTRRFAVNAEVKNRFNHLRLSNTQYETEEPLSNQAQPISKLEVSHEDLAKHHDRGLSSLLEKNRRWAHDTQINSPSFFTSLAKNQEPDILWIGCSDSRVPPTQILQLAPGDVFVHRSVANIVGKSETKDMSALAAVQFAVEVLKVKHIIVCGHYGCGGCQAVLRNDQSPPDIVDSWLRDVKNIYQSYKEHLDSLEPRLRENLLIELNILQSVSNIASSKILRDAWQRGQNVSVHAWCYELETGLVKDMGITLRSPDEITRIEDAIKRRIGSNQKELLDIN